MPCRNQEMCRIVAEELREALSKESARLTPWFYENMPDYYFLTHSREEQVRHLHAIITGQVTSERQTLVLRSSNGNRFTYISSCEEGNQLLAVLKRYAHTDLQAVRLYAMRDRTLRLDTMLPAPQERANPRSKLFRQALQSLREREDLRPYEPIAFASGNKLSLHDFLCGATRDYVEKFETERTARHYKMLHALKDSDSVQIVIEPLPQAGESRITICLTDPPKSGLLLQTARILAREKLIINRGYGDSFRWPDKKGFSELGVLSFYVSEDGGCLQEDCDRWRRMFKELKLIKWLFASHDLEAYVEEGWSLRRVMLLQAAAEFAHQFLIKVNLWAFTSDNIVRMLLHHKKEVNLLMAYFEARFDPEYADREAQVRRLEEEVAGMLACQEHSEAKQVLQCIFWFFQDALRTNYYLEDIHGLSFRMDPAFLRRMPGDPDAELPYGFYFYHGPYAQGFHVRYREMARGGLRVVSTRNQEQFELESNRLFDEVTKLAGAQQLKNKDIPEGGAKAVLLLGPEGDLDIAVKGMLNSLLDLVLTDGASPVLPGITDYLGKEEILYLGPDEQIAPRHIVWAVEKARTRGYRWPDAFMSSKPRAGINHKVYGVTSLGVVVFAEEILRYLGIDPYATPFTVKLTGGPRGDVAGNAVKLLVANYGDNARIVAMSDGHGSAFDPDGLAHEELLRLVTEDKSITAFAPDKLRGRGAFVLRADTPEGQRRRAALHNEVQADIFIPAGGRPETINESNWRQFLLPDGSPSARAIVEGANIFISPAARDRLEEHGVLIVHGSSANKTGVICSSYEILGGLIMSEEEFVGAKRRYVKEVLDILKERAGAEAKLMLRELRASGGSLHLTQISLALSTEINAVADAFYAYLAETTPDVGADPELCGVLLQYCPPVLAERFRERILTQVPSKHQYALVASFIASRIVYAEGAGWLERVCAQRDVREVFRAYLEQEKRLARFLEELRRSGITDKTEIARLLRTTGQKQLTQEALGLE